MIHWFFFCLLVTLNVENKYYKSLNQAFMATATIFVLLLVFLSFIKYSSTDNIIIASFIWSIGILNSVFLSFLISGFLGTKNQKLLLPNITPVSFRISKAGWINLAILIFVGVIVSVSSGILH